jgi:hypothetical protein
VKRTQPAAAAEGDGVVLVRARRLPNTAQRGIDDIGEHVLAVHQAGHSQALVHREFPGTGVDHIEDREDCRVEDVEG